MRSFVVTILLSLCSQFSYGQLDSSKTHVPFDSTKAKLFQVKTTSGIDSVMESAYALKDSVSLARTELNSVENGLNASLDSLTRSYANTLTQIQASSKKFQWKADSLQRLKLPNEQYKTKLDSVSGKLASVQCDMKSKIEEIKQKASEKINSIQFPPGMEEEVGKLKSTIANLNLNSINAKLPTELNLKEFVDLKNTVSLDGLPAMDKLNLSAVDGINQNVELPEIETGISGADGLKEISSMNGQASQLGSIDNLVESKALELEEVKALQDASPGLPLNVRKTEVELKKELQDQARKIAVDHFAGKEEKLKTAMEEITKYKGKYSSVNNVKEIPLKGQNAMKGKPFIERIIPGVGIQVQREGDNYLVDFNPYIGYRFTERITSGLGWNQRVAYNTGYDDFNSEAKIYGPRLFGEYKLWKGFSPRIEVEVMNTNVPSYIQTTTPDPMNNEWVWGAFAGIKKDYRFIKRVRGTASVMMRLFDPHNKSPHNDVVNVRMGFEFPLEKKTGTNLN